MVKLPYDVMRIAGVDMEALTEKQKAVLEFIEDRLDAARPPSQREIARHFGLSQNAVYQLVSYLRRKGYVVNVPGHRGIRLSERYLRHKGRGGVALVGRVAAGEPILAQENIEQYVDIGDFFGRGRDIFLLRVSGDSMVDEGIMDGDIVAVKPAAAVENGQIAVVLLDDEATVKKVYRRRGRIALVPANRSAGYRTIYVKPGRREVRIIGKVVGVLRKL